MRKVLALLLCLITFGVSYGQLTGTKNIPGDYATLADAVTALNTLGVGSGGVTLNLLAGNPQTAPAGGYIIGGAGTAILTTTSSLNQVIIQGNSNTITAFTPQTSGNLNDAVFKIIGADWITISGFTMQENAANTTTVAGTNNMTEWGVAILYATTTDGAQNITIQNNNISLNRTYQNTFGIYSNSTHSPTAPSTGASATGTSGGNHNLKIYTNNISNVNMGIIVIGPLAATDHNVGLDIGGSSLLTGNVITDYGTTGSFSSYQNVAGSVNGTIVRNTVNFNVSYNTYTSSNGGVTSGSLRAIFVPTFSNAPTLGTTMTINNNVISLRIGNTTQDTYGILVNSSTGTSNAVLSISNNDFNTFGSTVAGSSGAITYISNGCVTLSQDINNNTFTNITVNTTGSITFITNSVSVPATGYQNVNNNSIVTAFNKTGAGGTITLFTSNGSSSNGAVINHNNNNFSNITVTGATTIAGWSNTDGGTPTKTFQNNTFSNWTGGTSSITAMNLSYFGGNSIVSGNTINNLSCQSSITGITIGSSGAATSLAVNTNTITGLNSTGTGGSVTALSCSSPATVCNIYNNTINTLSSASTTSTVVGITSSATTANIYSNKINTLSCVATTSGVTNGIVVTSGTAVNVYKNKIYDLTTSGAFTTTPGVNGILISGGTTVNAYNNYVGDLKAPAASSVDAIRGISITSSTSTTNYNLYYNTVYLAASSTGTNLGTTALYHTASSTATTAKLDLRNNILVNKSTPAGTGLSVAYRRSSGSANMLNNYASTSNNNLFYAGAPGASNLLYSDGTGSAQTLANYIAGVFTAGTIAPRDAVSVTQNPTFTSTTGSASDYLHINTTVSTPIESGGIRITSPAIIDDYEGDIRQGETGYSGTGTSPDIGADEFNGVPSYSCAAPSPGNTISSSTSICLGQSINLSLQNSTSGTGVSYKWQSSPDGITYSDISGATSSTYSITPAASTYYQCVVTCQNGPVSATSTPVQVSFTNSITSTTPATRCGTGTVNLEASGSAGTTIKWYDAITAGNLLGSGSPWTTPIISSTTTYYAGAELSSISSGDAAIGTGTSSTSGFPSLFANYWYQVWQQFVYTAAELQAQGLVAGNITALKFKINTNTTSPFSSDFRISMGNTSNSTLTAFTTTGLTQVYGPASTNSSTGWVTYTLSTPYNWDGTSNILIDIRETEANGSSYASTYYTATTGNTLISAYKSGSSDPNFYTTSPSATGSTNRYNIVFTGQKMTTCASSRSAVVATVSTAPVLTLSANQTVCNNTVATVSVTSTLSDYSTYVWAPVTDLYTDLACTTPYDGVSSATTVYAKTTTAGAVTYTCTANNTTTLCSNTATSVVTTLPVPVVTATPASLCVSGVSNITTSPATGYSTSTFQWLDSDDNITFSEISGATTLNHTTPTLTATKYYKLQIKLGAAVCSESNVATVTVNNPSIASTTPGTRCGIGTVALGATGSLGTTLYWYAGSTGGVSLGTGTTFTTPVITGTTSYFVSAGVPNPSNITLGAGASTGTSYPYDPFNGGYGGAKSQYLYTAAELAAAGVIPGNISGLSFYATVIGTTYNGFNVQVGNTSLTDFTTTANIQGGLTTVYSASSISPTVGTNSIVFNSPFTWDGTSNIIVSFSWSNENTSNTSLTISYDGTANYSSQAYRKDNETAANLLAFTGSTGTGSFSTSQSRPKITFAAMGSCSSTPRTEVVATVTPAPAITVSSTPEAICNGNSGSLSATSTDLDYTYLWSTTQTGSPVSVSPTTNTTYTVTATNSTTGCVNTGTTSVTVNPTPSAVTVNPSTASICEGVIRQLTASGGTFGSSGSGFIGTGTVNPGTSSYPNPLSGYYGGARHQMLFTSNELITLGLSANSKITTIGLNLSAYTSAACNDFTIRIIPTSLTLLTGFVTGGTTVYNASYTPSATGQVNFSLATPYTWDGTSNLIIEMVHNAGNGGNGSGTRAYCSTTASNMCYYGYQDNVSPATAAGFMAIAPTNTGASTSRPNIYFGFSASQNPITWLPITDLYTDPDALIAYTGTPSTSVYAKPLSNQIYTATATSGLGCSNSGTSTITVNSIPSAPVVGLITQPTCTTATGSVVLSGLPSGNWTLNPGGITGSGNTTTLTGLTTGTHNYTVTSDASCTSVASADIVILSQPETPAAPIVGTITQPTCATATGSVELTGLPSGNWTIEPGTITGTGASKTITGLAAGTHNFTVTNSVGCTSSASADVVINAQPITPAAPTVGTITQPTCATATGSVVLEGLPSGNWTIEPGTITGTGASISISPLTAGTYNYTVTNSVGCTSLASADIVINAQPVTPAIPTVGTITQPTCATATGSVVLSGLPAGNWTIEPGTITGTGASTTISGLATGTHNFTVTNSVGCTSLASADVVINAQPITPAAPTVGTLTQPTCTTATGSVELTGLPSGNWTIEPGAITGTGASTILSGLATGTHNYTVTNSVGCTSLASADIVINEQPITPVAPTVGTITQPTCATATGSVVLNGLPSGNYTINPGPFSGSSSTYTITGLTAGTYNYTVTNSVGCTSLASADVVINAQPITPVAPTVGTITQPTCATATGSAVLSGLPSGSWTIEPGTITGTGTSTTLSGIATGTHNYTVTNSVGCTSLASADIVINEQPITPAAPTVGTITQPTCETATGSVVLGGLPSGNYTINPGPFSGSSSTYTITGLTEGTYNYTVTNSVGCTSSASNDIVINAQPPTPVVTDQSTSILTGATFTVIPGSVPSGTTYTWTAPSYTGGVSGGSAETDPQTSISGTLTIPSGVGTATYTVTPTAGVCVGNTFTVTVTVTSSCVPVSVENQPVGASMCNNTGNASFTVGVNGTSPYNYQWQYNNGGSWEDVSNGSPLGAVYTGNTSTNLHVSGITTAGNYEYHCYITNCSGSTNATTNDVILTVNPTPSAPVVGTITQPTCATATGSVVLSGLPSGNWTINPGTITGTGTSTTLSGLATGTHNYTVTSSSGCTSAASNNIVINAQPITPTAPTVGTITQPTCAIATGSVVLNGLPSGNWTIEPGTITGTGSSHTISGLATGTHNFTVTNSVGCTSLASNDVVINAQPITPATPAVGTITQPTCATATGSVFLNGLPSGNWTIEPGTITGTGASHTISGLAQGTYNYTVTNSVGCTSLASNDIVINAQPITPSVPTVGTITQPTCATATGSVVLSGLPSGNWTIDPGTITGTGASTTISGLATGTHNFTVTNSVGCTSVASADVVINAQPITPAAPTVGTITQPTCATATGSVQLTGLPSGNWTIEPGTITGTGTSHTISGLATGTHNFTVTNSVGCTSIASNDVVINAQPITPAAPVVGTITQPTCATATGSVVLNGLPSGNWTIEPGTITGTGSSHTISGLAQGTYNYTVTNSVGCTSVASNDIVINAQPITPSVPTVGTITQPTCATATGSVVLSGLPSGNWTIDPGTITGTGASTTISGLATGTHNFTVTNSVGCTSVASADVVINAQPITPAAPTVGIITQPTCATATGSVQLTGLPSGNWTIEPGTITGTGSSTTISGLTPGTYYYLVTNSVGCTSLSSTGAVINAQPITPTAPAVGIITQPNCTTATGSVVLNGLPSGNWTIEPGTITGSGTSTTISGLTQGTYNYTITNSVGCTSLASDDIVINAQPITPTAPIVGIITQPTCATATGSVVLSGLPSGNWTIEPGTITGTGASTTISGLAEGTYNFSVTNSAGCTSVVCNDIVVNAQPITPSVPAVGTVTQPTCATATGSVLLLGLPSGNWTIEPGTITGTGSSTTISGLSQGTYNYTVTNSAGCTSTASADIIINAQPITPSAPQIVTITQPTCSTATGSVSLNGLPSGNWTINPGGITGSGATTTISVLAQGTYNYTVTNSDGCTSVASNDIVINAQPVTPPAPAIGTTTQPTCSSPTGSVILYGLPSGNWTIEPGTITGSGASITVNGLTQGTYNFTVTNSVGCTSVASNDVIINAQPATPATPMVGTITQPTCTTANGSVELTGLPAGNWTINPGSITGTGTSTTISGLTQGTYNYTVTNSVGCVSIATTDIVINAQPATPSAPGVGIITQPTCTSATGSVVLNGLPSGSWTINPGAITGTGADTTINGLVAGTYNYTVTNSVGCTSSASNDIVINTQPASPVVYLGVDTTICENQSIILDAGNTGANYLWSPGGQITQTVTIDTLGIHTGAHAISVFVTTPNGCTATDTVIITFDPCSSIAENEEFGNMTIYPNPTSGKVTLTITGVNENVKLSVATVQGQVIYSDNFYVNYSGISREVDLSPYPKGIYFIRLTNDKSVNVKKVVVD